MRSFAHVTRLLCRRTLHSIDDHGLRGTLARVLRPQRNTVPALPEPHPFDLLHNVDTGGYIPGEALAGDSTVDMYSTAYYAISPSTLTQALASLPFDPSDYTFVDLGCGKGRALLVAAHLTFARIVGVELSPALATIARANTAAYPSILVLTDNAATVKFPAGPLVVFLYHPFLAPRLKEALRNLLSQRAGRDLYIVIANPAYPKIFAGFPMLVEQWTRDFTLSPEDAAADRHGIVFERYTLWKAT